MHVNMATEETATIPHRQTATLALSNNWASNTSPISIVQPFRFELLHKSKHHVLMPGTNVYVSLIYVVSHSFIY